MNDFPVPSGKSGGRATVPTSNPGANANPGGLECIGSWRTRIGDSSIDGATWLPHARVHVCG